MSEASALGLYKPWKSPETGKTIVLSPPLADIEDDPMHRLRDACCRRLTGKSWQEWTAERDGEMLALFKAAPPRPLRGARGW